MKKSLSILFAFIYTCSLFLSLVSVASATSTIPPGMDISQGILWEYTGDDTTVTIPDSVMSIKAGAFYDSKVEVIIIPDSDVIIRGNAFTDAYHLTDIYFYSKDVSHLRNMFTGDMCKHGELVCTDTSCSVKFCGLITTILAYADTDVDSYISKTLTIHGYKGSTAERFVEIINANKELFCYPQTLVFQAIEGEEEKAETPATPEEAPKEEEQEDPPKETAPGVHLKGTKGTALYIDSLCGITYPRHIYMSVGSYYILELGNLTDGYSYTIPALYSRLGTLDTKTGEFKALQAGTITAKIQLVFPDGRRANVPCRIYIKGD